MLPDLPITVITAYGDAATLRRAKQSGAHGVFGRLIDFVALKAEIDQRLMARGLPA
jgi:AmiR/NasT family two-component response regulator